MPEGKVIALDLGTRKTGVAITDPSRRVVFLREPLVHQNESDHLKNIQTLLSQEKPTTVVLGLSLMQGEETAQSKYSREIKRKIETFYSGAIVWIDESYSSFEAEEEIQGDLSHSQAARIILESFLHQTEQGG